MEENQVAWAGSRWSRWGGREWWVAAEEIDWDSISSERIQGMVRSGVILYGLVAACLREEGTFPFLFV